jgi:hypothetical protein
VAQRDRAARLFIEQVQLTRASCDRPEEQRCTAHALRNVTSKLPDRHRCELKARWWRVFDDAASAADARRGLEGIIADYRAAYPSGDWP